jgi:hypothetical protein
MIKPNSLFKPIKATPKRPELSRLLSAAVVNDQFRSMLLCDPASAVVGGYEDERFAFDRLEIEKLSAIRATSLREFAAQLAAI